MPRLSAEPEENFELFVRRVRDTKVVWGLKSDKGWAVCESNEYEDTLVYPFWSEESFARPHCVDEWSSYRPAPIPLASFIDEWLEGMDEDDALVGTNWDAELTGVEVEPLDLAEQLSEAG
jgi:hypothetical protein